MKRILPLLIVMFMFSACGPSPEEIASQTHTAETATAAMWTKTPTLTPTPTITPTPTPTSTPTPMPTPIGGSGKILIVVRSNYRDCGEDCEESIVLLDLSTSSQTVVLDGYSLLGLSPDRKQMLVTQGNQLFISDLDGKNMLLLSDKLFEEGWGYVSYWLPESDRIVFIALDEVRNTTSINLINSDGTGLTQIPTTYQPILLFPSVNEEKVYWERGVFSAGEWMGVSGPGESTRWVSLDGAEQGKVNWFSPYFSPDGEYVAYDNDDRNDYFIDKVFVSKIDGTGEILIKEEWCTYQVYWSPNSDKLIIPSMYYDGTNVERKTSVYDLTGTLIFEFPEEFEQPLGFSWSPDMKTIFFFSRVWTGSAVLTTLHLLDNDTYEITDLDFELPENTLIYSPEWLNAP